MFPPLEKSIAQTRLHAPCTRRSLEAIKRWQPIADRLARAEERLRIRCPEPR
jgi:hypothetical protein